MHARAGTRQVSWQQRQSTRLRPCARSAKARGRIGGEQASARTRADVVGGRKTRSMRADAVGGRKSATETDPASDTLSAAVALEPRLTLRAWRVAGDGESVR